MQIKIQTQTPTSSDIFTKLRMMLVNASKQVEQKLKENNITSLSVHVCVHICLSVCLSVCTYVLSISHKSRLGGRRQKKTIGAQNST